VVVQSRERPFSVDAYSRMAEVGIIGRDDA